MQRYKDDVFGLLFLALLILGGGIWSCERDCPTPELAPQTTLERAAIDFLDADGDDCVGYGLDEIGLQSLAVLRGARAANLYREANGRCIEPVPSPAAVEAPDERTPL